mmetsp:Transcript_9982/g.31656  ORF Transcript_9982/g.31656 Transcript_9982/m.31656 type:complete len:173 (-) Transcript_9982:135-653(-)
MSKPRIQILRRDRGHEHQGRSPAETNVQATTKKEVYPAEEREAERQRREQEYELLRERMGLAAVEDEAGPPTAAGLPPVSSAVPLTFSLFDRRGAIPAQILVTTAAERQAQQAQFEKQQRELLMRQQAAAAAAASVPSAACAPSRRSSAKAPAGPTIVGPSFSPTDFPPLSA